MGLGFLQENGRRREEPAELTVYTKRGQKVGSVVRAGEE